MRKKNSSKFSAIVLTFAFCILNFSIASAVEKIAAPEIVVNPDIYYPQEEVLYIEGRAKLNSTVQIQFQKSGAKLMRVVSKSDSRGEWVFTEKVPLEAGDWEVRARIIEGEVSSDWSNPRVIRAIVSGITLGGITIKFSFIVLLLFLAVAAVIYFYWRMKREMREKAGALIEQDFSELRRDIEEEIKHLERKGNLSEEEKGHRDHLLRELERVEKDIVRKVRDIQ